MKRSELEIGGRYAGPEGMCYEIVDLSPGWRINGAGDWVKDGTQRTRHMPGRGEVAYRANLAVKAYLVTEDGTKIKAVVDPRKLSEPWGDHEFKKAAEERERIHTQRLLTLMRRNLRTYPGHRPSPASRYVVSSDGSTVTIPRQDLSALLDLAFTEKY
jgi:hypothetical protein